ncbi:biopolymer transporter ExbD [Luteimonas fraxinea]|jgi:biopolymer transport protein TolR|uniref:Biopolymer transporter ExbD n=1 Tax=Luteimonas fraxinea TaxID=2901869 RepID=A0ABS8UGQ6_9GAMM|nr:biopolymer transporter ExbD [Luteimonas fraxinea]MCD9098152.1 biopolymer transporter ExbD [Luteimonas fraxinea]MCD9125318.1 biopolymer transporter ExbD [Luteimonas fraxinea]UHH09124.1 biopolymer transporter ExbD [Luteimonas fraxinea]
MSSISLRRSKRRKLKNEINVVPYIDVMLVLLIIFMVTTPLMNLGTDINLPDSRAMSLGSPQDPVVVSVYPDGQLALMVERQNTSVTREDLVARLRGIHTQNPDATILVSGDGAASYQRIMNAIDLINEAGITKVSLISRPAESAN